MPFMWNSLQAHCVHMQYIQETYRLDFTLLNAKVKLLFGLKVFSLTLVGWKGRTAESFERNKMSVLPSFKGQVSDATSLHLTHEIHTLTTVSFHDQEMKPQWGFTFYSVPYILSLVQSGFSSGIFFQVEKTTLKTLSKRMSKWTVSWFLSFIFTYPKFRWLNLSGNVFPLIFRLAYCSLCWQL